eukprot:9801886-Alexandrium_andersonii.AAC.1
MLLGLPKRIPFGCYPFSLGRKPALHFSVGRRSPTCRCSSPLSEALATHALTSVAALLALGG